MAKRTIADRMADAAKTGKEAVFYAAGDDLHTGTPYEFSPAGIVQYLTDIGYTSGGTGSLTAGSVELQHLAPEVITSIEEKVTDAELTAAVNTALLPTIEAAVGAEIDAAIADAITALDLETDIANAVDAEVASINFTPIVTPIVSAEVTSQVTASVGPAVDTAVSAAVTPAVNLAVDAIDFEAMVATEVTTQVNASVGPLVDAALADYDAGPNVDAAIAGAPNTTTGYSDFYVSTAGVFKKAKFVFVNVRDYGALGDGTTNDRAAFQAAIDAVAAQGGGVVWVPMHTTTGYVIAQNGTTGYGLLWASGVRLCGASMRCTIRRTSGGAYNLIRAQGVSVLTSQNHINYGEISNLCLDGRDGGSPIVLLMACSNWLISRVRFFASTRELLKGYEFFDSRIEYCRFDWGSDTAGTYYAVDLASGSDGTNTWEYTNQIHINNCIWESTRGKCFGFSGTNTNEIFIMNCKMEAISSNTSMFNISGAANVTFNQLQLTTAGAAGNTIADIFTISSTSLVRGNITWEHSGTPGSSSALVTRLATLTNCFPAELKIFCYATAIEKISSPLTNPAVVVTGSGTLWTTYGKFHCNVDVGWYSNTTGKLGVTKDIPTLATDKLWVKSLNRVANTTSAAAGTLQSDATLIDSIGELVLVTSGTGGVKLPDAPSVGDYYEVWNCTGSTINVYPNTSDTINGGAANAAVTVASNAKREFYATSSTAWRSVVTA